MVWRDGLKLFVAVLLLLLPCVLAPELVAEGTTVIALKQMSYEQKLDELAKNSIRLQTINESLWNSSIETSKQLKGTLLELDEALMSLKQVEGELKAVKSNLENSKLSNTKLESLALKVQSSLTETKGSLETLKLKLKKLEKELKKAQDLNKVLGWAAGILGGCAIGLGTYIVVDKLKDNRKR